MAAAGHHGGAGGGDPSSKTIRLEIPPEVSSLARARARSVLRSPRRRTNLTGAQAVAAAAIENADLRALFDNVYDAALIADLKGQVVDANPRASQAFGFTTAELCSRSMASVVLGFDDGVMRTVCDNLTNDQFTLIQAFCRRKDGTHFPAEISTSRLHLFNREYLCFFIRDVTARREAEEQIKRAHDELEIEVRERTKLNEDLNAEIAVRAGVEGRLRDAIVKLQEHDLAKSQFVSNVSHELKTPLASINHVAGNLLKGIAGPLSDHAREYLGMIRTDCRRLTRTVDDILDMSRIEAKALKLQCVKLRFPEFVRQTAESLRIQVDAAGLLLSVSVEKENVFVYGDPRKIERVLYNLIHNAIKFNTPQGSIGVALCVDVDQPGYVRLDVTDTGIGIEPEHLSRVTERFFRIGEHVSGAGLGLAICKELVEHHGGGIVLQSPPPGQRQGTRVCVWFPITTPPVAVLVSDDTESRDAVVGQMTAGGYVTRSVLPGPDVIRDIAAQKPDLIVLNWATAGLEVGLAASVVKQSEALRQIPMLILSSDGDSPVKQEILAGVGAPILTAPWSTEDLFRRIEQGMIGRKSPGG